MFNVWTIEISELGHQFYRHEYSEKRGIGPKQAQRDVHPAVHEKDRSDECESNHPYFALERSVPVEQMRQNQAKHESGQNRMTGANLGEKHQDKESEEDQLDLRFDHTLAIAPEQVRRDARRNGDDAD